MVVVDVDVVNNGLGLIAWKQDNRFGYHVPLSFDNPDWCKLAEAFGWKGYRVRWVVYMPRRRDCYDSGGSTDD